MRTLQGALRGDRLRDVIRRSTIVGLISFLTLIDLFGSQALLPHLTEAFQTDPRIMGIAVNASTFGMALSSLVVAWFASQLDRKRGIWISLALLSVPTFFLGVVDSVAAFTALRVLQGVFMAAAFTLTLTYLSEQCDVTAAGGAMAAYIAGNVASNLFGRLLAVSAADAFGLSETFWLFALLNLVGAGLALWLIGPRDTVRPVSGGAPLTAWKAHLSHSALRVSFLIGFGILSVFVGVFTYVNLHLTETLGLDMRALGQVYFVFLPAMVLTLYAARAVSRFGPRIVLQVSSAVVLIGLALGALSNLAAVLAGLALIAAGTFFMQGATTGFVGRTARQDRAAANGLYLASYYVGGMVGAVVMGQLNALGGWSLVSMTAGAVVVMIFLVSGALRDPGPEVIPNRFKQQG